MKFSISFFQILIFREIKCWSFILHILIFNWKTIWRSPWKFCHKREEENKKRWTQGNFGWLGIRANCTAPFGGPHDILAAWLGGRDDVVPGHFFGLGGGWNQIWRHISGVLLLFENNKINLIITLDGCHGQPTLNETQRIYRLASYLVFDVSHRPVLPSPVWTFF